MKHYEVLKTLVETAFPVATVRNIAVPSPRIGTEADLIYGLSNTATLGGVARENHFAQKCVFEVVKENANPLPMYDASRLPFFSTSTLLGDCASYCSIGFDPATEDKQPWPLMAPRLNPRRMCLDAVVMLPGYEPKDLQRVVVANLVKQLPRLDLTPDGAPPPPKVPSYVRKQRHNDPRGYEAHGLRVLSDCIEVVIDSAPPKNHLRTKFMKGSGARYGEEGEGEAGDDSASASSPSTTRRTMYVGFANPSWAMANINRSLNEDERAPRRVYFGASRETLRRSLPRPIIEASRLLTTNARRMCAGTRHDLPPIYWLNAAMVASCAQSHIPNPILSERVVSYLDDVARVDAGEGEGGAYGSSGCSLSVSHHARKLMPPRSQWEHANYNRSTSWAALVKKQPAMSLAAPFHFEIVSDDEGNRIIGAHIAQHVCAALRPNHPLLTTLSTILPTETFYHPHFKTSAMHVFQQWASRPPNFLADVTV